MIKTLESREYYTAHDNELNKKEKVKYEEQLIADEQASAKLQAEQTAQKIQ